MPTRALNAVQCAVLANRSNLVLREGSLDADVDRILRPLLDEWERVIRRSVSRRARNLTPSELAAALRRTVTLRDLQAVSVQFAAAVEREVRRTVEGVFRSEAYRAAHIAATNPTDARVSAGFGGVSKTAVLAADRSVLPGRSLTTSFRSLAAGVVPAMRRDLARAVGDGWDLDALTEKWSQGVGAGRLLTDARALARTAMMAASNEGQVLAWRAEGRYRELRWNATFDARTCPFCGARHGRVYPIDNLPPLPCHPQCRCVWVPVFAPDSQRLLERPSRYVREGPGVLAGRTRSYEAWLRKQPRGVQADALGSELKLRAWRSGDLSLLDLSKPDATTISDDEARALLARP